MYTDAALVSRACPREGVSMDEVDRIAQEVLRRIGTAPRERNFETARQVPVSVSARHVHISRTVLDRLFGEGFQLTRLRDLKQPGEFAAEQTVGVIGPSMRGFERVRILGPVRNYTQVEIARTDAIRLGIDPPIRRSGDLAGSESLTLVGPRGTIRLNEGAIRAVRHVHMTERDASIFGVRDGDLVRARFGGERALILENVLIRAGKRAALELHVDTDDGNAADVRSDGSAELLT